MSKEKLPENEIENTIELVKCSCLVDKVGGPFGAFVFDENGKVVGRGVNKVIGNNDPTAHAEIVAIRDACKNLGTHDLSGYFLYATGKPCPMCMSAIIWSNIKKVYYSATFEDASEIGFRDDFIFKFLKEDCTDTSVLELAHHPNPKLKDVYKAYSQQGEIY